LLVVVGTIAGFLNVVGGGGSLITLPVLIFTGLPPAVANASNRIAIVLQNIFAVTGFTRKGVHEYPYSFYLSISAVIGSLIGAELASIIDGKYFNRLLSVIMLIVLVTILKPKKIKKEAPVLGEVINQKLGVFYFFFIGIYGGFLHAGVGFVIMAVLANVNGFSLVKSNAIKVTVALVYTLAAVAVFIYKGMINWQFAITMGVGNSIGGWFGSYFSVAKGDRWIRIILLIIIPILAIKLWFYD